MNRKSLGFSQKALVTDEEDHSVPAKKLPQYIASLSATLGALASGMVLAWTSSAGPDGTDLATEYNISISRMEFSWIGSLFTLGSAVICVPIGILSDIIGRKTSMLLMVIPFTVGWLLIILSNSLVMFYVGRFITGLASGAFNVVVPIYTAEISENSIRGRLGSYLQLLLGIGVLLSYALGNCVSMFTLSIVSAIAPLVFFVIFLFMPESPTYYLQKGNKDAARKSLIRLYGEQYDIDGALNSKLEAIEANRKNKISFSTMIKSRVTRKGFIIGYGLMIFQQLSGLNIIFLYGSSIFSEAGSDIPPGICMIIIGSLPVVAVMISTVVVDHLGRRILLLASIISMCLTTFALGVYFYLQKIDVDVKSIAWLPLLSVCLFVIMFAFGFGPIPWMMVGEIFAPEVKGVAASSTCLLNWVMAFFVTRFYTDLKGALGAGGTFWLLSGISAIGIFFVYILVPETKGKSLEGILRDL